MSAGAYSAEVLDLFRRAPGAGRPEGPGWLSAEAREPLTATHVRVHLRAADGRITDVRYEVRGCPDTVAVLARASQGLLGRPVHGVLPDVRSLAVELGAPTGKLGRFLVVQQAIEHAALQLSAGSA